MTRYTITFFLTAVLASAVAHGQTGKVTGHLVIKNPNDSAVVREHVMVWLKHDGDNWWITWEDKNFNFSFDSLTADTTEIRITTCTAYLDTIITNVIIKNNQTTHLEIPYPPYCIYDKTKNDSICPVCKKQDEVTRIAYDFEINKIPRGKKKKNQYYLDHKVSTGCDPHWYCKRDKKEF